MSPRRKKETPENKTRNKLMKPVILIYDKPAREPTVSFVE